MALGKAGMVPVVSQHTWSREAPSSERSRVIHRAIAVVLLSIYQQPEHLLVRGARNQLSVEVDAQPGGGDYGFSPALHTG